MSAARVVFFGSGEIAIPAFRRLIDSGPRPVALVTQPDRPAGRHRIPTAPPIKRVAVEAGIPVLQPESVRDPQSLAVLEGLEADLMVVMAYGQILPKRLLAMPRLACINLHASLLPRHRGAACIQAAIDAGDSETGITVMHVAPKLDAGDIIHAIATPILPEDTGGSLHDRLAEIAAHALAEALPGLLDGSAPRIPQDDSLATYVPKLEREDGRIDWSRPATEIARRVRAYDPWPGTWCWLEDGDSRKRLKIFPGRFEAKGGGTPGEIQVDAQGEPRITCGSGSFVPREVQPDGGRRMTAAEWVRGWRPDSSPRLA